MQKPKWSNKDKQNIALVETHATSHSARNEIHTSLTLRSLISSCHFFFSNCSFQFACASRVKGRMRVSRAYWVSGVCGVDDSKLCVEQEKYIREAFVVWRLRWWIRSEWTEILCMVETVHSEKNEGGWCRVMWGAESEHTSEKGVKGWRKAENAM